ncbi:MAG: FHA domain-containing protein [Planctomycetota bacterium]|nr:MAG: FHA domain-containing protein [Planctomycetota bacterium]
MDVLLILFKETGERKDFPLNPGKTIIGRKEECDLRIPLAEVSRKHAMIMIDENSVTIRDMGSSNGTYVNNQKISEQEISAGDHIVVGPVVLTVQIDGEPSDIKPVHTRMEARSPVANAVSIEETGPGESDTIETKDILSTEEDPISALEALAGTDDTSAIDVDESFTEADEDENK